MNHRSPVLQNLQKLGERNVTRSQKTSIVEAEKYLAENKIEEMFNELLAQVIQNRPKDVKKFLREQLELQIKLQGDNYYITKQDIEAIFLNYDFFQENKVPYTMLVQALGLVGVEYSVKEFLERYPQYEAQKYIVKEQFIMIMTDEYRERLKKYKKKNEDAYMLQAIASDTFVNDILIYCDLELKNPFGKELYGCMKRILDYMIKNPELCVLEQFTQALQPELTTAQMSLILNATGIEFMERGYFKQSEQFLKGCLQFRFQNLGENSIEVAKCYNNIGLLKRQQEEFDDSMTNFQKSLRIYQNFYGKDHIACLEILENIAILLRSQQNYDLALNQYENILKIKENRFGPNHIETAQTIENIAVVLIKKQRFDEAIEKLQKVLEIKKKKQGENSMTVAGTLHNISLALEAKQQFKQALKLSKNALSISKNESLTNSFVRTVENHVKNLEKNIEEANEQLDVSQEL
ncbi:tetratricopeptide repeat protein (macronuclear) [Tetrahymena thermophila SB210]|uniref:Tetratricopeptide repeat protein n=1 Tax=Tetrahymena thermophila (strain SB210) TaxID=312017 RepID=Q240Y0_TETTS|nr:tetratricopeptide repeat protein [Tetrahymena thermophila SB210]EAS02284.2 tetratricopeptide repeat protein [Tetrahymena thermophila SB210]|eukprot:XP_001022529.2 tetratricopeptide repeat protein [Tetrahymena thermophila SB210]